jgi:hypothetical protein
MTVRRTVLGVEELGGRVLPSATVATAVPLAAAAQTTTSTTTTGSAWTGQGRFTLTTNKTTAVETYALQGSVDIGSSNFFTISGSVSTVGSKAGHATGKVVLSGSKGTLTLNVTGPSQAARAGFPATATYTVVSGTGMFSHYSGHGTIKISPTLFPGDTDRGHFSVSATAPVGSSTGPVQPPTKPPVPNTTKGPSWTGQGRYTLAANRTTGVKTYTLQGSADFGPDGFFAIGGSIHTVGNVASGKASGRITISDKRGTLVLSVTGPTQSRNAGLPSSLTYIVVSGTGFFAKYVGQGAVQLSAPLFMGYFNQGHFSISVRPTSK